MWKRATLFALVLGLAALGSPAARASFAEVPLEILVDEADVIAQGKVTKIADAGFAREGRKYDAATLRIDKVLKGPDKLTHVRIAQPGGGSGPELSTDIRFQEGQDGIWLLTRDGERDVYWALHPSQFQPAKEKATLARLVAVRDKVAGGKAVRGLEARAEAAKGEGGPEVRFSLKNVSDKPITVCTWVGNRPLEVKWTDPDGKERESEHYKWLEAARIRGLAKENFITIPAGGVRHVGPRGGTEGIVFMDLQPGKHQITVSFTSKEDGKQFGLKDVWTGTVAANPVTLTAK